MGMPDDEISLEIEDAAPIAALASDADDEAAELAAADAEIDAEEEALAPDEDGEDPDEGEEGDEEADGEGKGDEREFDDGEEEPEESEDRAEEAPRIELTPDVYARIRECLSTQMAAIEAQIARAERVSDADPFFDRWKVVLLAQRDRLRGQIAQADAKAPAAATAAPVATDEVLIEQPEPLSA